MNRKFFRFHLRYCPPPSVPFNSPLPSLAPSLIDGSHRIERQYLQQPQPPHDNAVDGGATASHIDGNYHTVEAIERQYHQQRQQQQQQQPNTATSSSQPAIDLPYHRDRVIAASPTAMIISEDGSTVPMLNDQLPSVSTNGGATIGFDMSTSTTEEWVRTRVCYDDMMHHQLRI